MATALFHINDNCLQIQQSNVLEQSRGYAWLKDDQVLFDLDPEITAVSHCRLSPQEINSHYWQQCEQSAIPVNAANMRHAADLVWQHLKQLQQQHGLSDIAFVVPSHYQSSNLQLLLGIARACQLNVQALLNKSVLALQQSEPEEGEYLHMDVQLHQTVCAEVNVANGVAKLGAVEIIQNVGIQAMYDALLKAIQSNFISNDRFDPLHHAQTEQQVFDQLASIAKEISDSGKANISVDHQQRLHTTSIDGKQWQACLAPFTKTLISAGAKYSNVVIDLNNAFNGESLAECDMAGLMNLTTPIVDVSSLISNLNVDENSKSGEGLIYKTELSAMPATDSPVSLNTSSQNTKSLASEIEVSDTSMQSSSVTHVLCAGQAIALEHASIALNNNQLSISYAVQGNLQNLLTDGTLFVLNDSERRNMADLQVNDRLGSNLADGVITVVQVL